MTDEPLKNTLWAVVHTDDGGNSFLMKEGLTQTEAEIMIEEYASKGHKQHYTSFSYEQGRLQSILAERRIYQ